MSSTGFLPLATTRAARQVSFWLPILAWSIASGCSENPAPATALSPRVESPTAPTKGNQALPAAAPQPAPHPVPRFVDVARLSGIDFEFMTDAVRDRFFLPEVMGGGAAWVDYDGDGRLDLYVRDGCRLKDPASTPAEHVSRLFRNLGNGGFGDVSRESVAALLAYGQGCAAGDLDADGFPDLYLVNYGPNALLRNNGDGTFANVTTSAGVGDDRWGSSAIWFDADGDMLLDLYLVNYLNVTAANTKVCDYNGEKGYCGPGHYEAVPDVLYRNLGNGTFADATEELGFHETNGKGLAVVAVDLDDDLRPEVYVANDMTPNHLFTRSVNFDVEGQLRAMYANVAHSAGCALSGAGMNEAGMGIACADFDSDGQPDLLVTHYYHTKNTLYHNLGKLMFDDDSRRTRIAAMSFESLGFGIWAFDYDRDGDPDLFISNGHVLGPYHSPNEMRPQLLLNTRGMFSDLSDEAGEYFLGRWLGRGVAAADYDDDGDIDLVVTHLDRPLALLRNDTETPGCRFIGLQLETESRIPPVGGRVVVTCGSLRQVLPVMAGGSYLSTSDTRLLAGLGNESGPVQVEIHWPSGRVDRFDDLQTGGYWRLREGHPPRPMVR